MVSTGAGFNIGHVDNRSLTRVKFINTDLQIGAELFKLFDAQQYLPADLFSCRVRK
jgi:hypothetical protein